MSTHQSSRQTAEAKPNRHARLAIDLSAVRANYQYLKSLAPGSRVIAVVKADAYGHGAIEVANALSNADAFAVATVREAIELRESAIEQRIIVLGGALDSDELAACFHHRLDPVFHQWSQIQWLQQFADPGSIDAWLKLNSGMGRLGFDPSSFTEALEELEKCRSVTQVRLMTHLANADDSDDQKTTRQIAIVNQLDLAHYEWSIGNSAGILNWPQSRADWVRAGIALYGSDPMLNQAFAQELKPVMTFKSRVMAVNQLKQGDTVGYGGRYTCSSDEKIAVVAAGYADGYPRHMQGGFVMVNGHRADVVGRVSMDMITIKVSEREVKIGDEVTLWGEAPRAEAVAEASETIAYELFCNAGRHGVREYMERAEK